MLAILLACMLLVTIKTGGLRHSFNHLFHRFYFRSIGCFDTNVINVSFTAINNGKSLVAKKTSLAFLEPSCIRIYRIMPLSVSCPSSSERSSTTVSKLLRGRAADSMIVASTMAPWLAATLRPLSSKDLLMDLKIFSQRFCIVKRLRKRQIVVASGTSCSNPVKSMKSKRTRKASSNPTSDKLCQD